jgi:predicted DNA binding CopG/RHH family protein
MKDPFAPMDEYEKELMDYTETEAFTPAAREMELKEYFSRLAQETLKKDQRMNIRISERDMKGLKALSIQEGIPNQTLAASILHKYVIRHLGKV